MLKRRLLRDPIGEIQSSLGIEIESEKRGDMGRRYGRD